MNEPVTDAPCPFCKGVHYSIYNAERCATRHRIAQELATYDETETKEREAKQLTPEQAKAKGWKFWLKYCDRYGYTVGGVKV